MGQQEVYNLLKKHRTNWLSAKDIADKLRVSVGSVTVSLSKLRKTNLIYFRSRSETKNSIVRNKCYTYKFKK